MLSVGARTLDVSFGFMLLLALGTIDSTCCWLQKCKTRTSCTLGIVTWVSQWFHVSCQTQLAWDSSGFEQLLLYDCKLSLLFPRLVDWCSEQVLVPSLWYGLGSHSLHVVCVALAVGMMLISKQDESFGGIVPKHSRYVG